MHHTGYKKESKKEILKKENKKGYEKFASRGFEPGPSESVRTKSLRLKPLDHLGEQREFKRRLYSFSMLIGSFQGWLFTFRVELNL